LVRLSFALIDQVSIDLAGQGEDQRHGVLADIRSVDPLHVGEDDAAIAYLGDADAILDTRGLGLNPPQLGTRIDQIRIAI